jgi:uncharacterized membrane protein
MNTHLATVVPCIFLLAYLLLAKKGGKIHRKLGMVYMALMSATAFLTLLLPPKVGPQFLNHFGSIHILSFVVMWTVPTALIAIKKGNVKAHQRKIVILYVSAILIAGAFTFVSGRYLHEVFFG